MQRVLEQEEAEERKRKEGGEGDIQSLVNTFLLNVQR
jgi:hypothetical protein